MNFHYVLGFALSMVLLGVGCAEETLDGVHVWGNATWGGSPIPSGKIVFTPDSSKGNSGHQSWATIKDGRFDTREQDSKIVTKGPTMALIRSSQKSADLKHPLGTELVLRHTLAIEVPAESGELDIDVPTSVQPVVSMPEGPE